VVSSHPLQASYKSGTHRGNRHHDQSRGKQRIHGALFPERSASAINASSRPVIANGAAITGVYPIAIADNQPAVDEAC